MRLRVGALLVGLALAACATAAIPQEPPTPTTATAEAVATTTPSTTVVVARPSGPVAAMGFTAGEPVDIDLPDLGAPALVATCTPEQWFPGWRAWEVVSSNQVPVQVTLVPGSGAPITFSAASGTTWLLAPAEDGSNPASLVFAGSTVASVDEAGPVCQPEDPVPQLPTIVQGCRLGGDVTAWTIQSGDQAVVATLETPGGSLTGTASGGSVWYLPSGSARLVVGGEVIARAEPADCPDPASGLKSLESACATIDGATERWWRVGNGTAVGVSVRLSGAGTVEGVAAPGDSWWFMAAAPDGTVSLAVRDEVFVDSTAGSVCGQPPPTTVPSVTTTVPPTTEPPTTTTEPSTTTTEPPTTTSEPPTTSTQPATTTTTPPSTTTTRPPPTTTRPPTP
ncbi:MAG TPA: hypothetical protein VHM94_12455, partial [Acidimicrobiia bacterium]|nr:hypothetical protein [Acidimicrobiia bacterium]